MLADSGLLPKPLAKLDVYGTPRTAVIVSAVFYSRLCTLGRVSAKGSCQCVNSAVNHAAIEAEQEASDRSYAAQRDHVGYGDVRRLSRTLVNSVLVLCVASSISDR